MSQTDASETIFDDFSENTIFKSEIPLGFEYTPDIKDIIGRDKMIKKVTNRLQRIPEGEYGVPFVVTGDTGYGKTTVVRAVLKELQKKMDGEGLDFGYTYVEDRENEREVLRKLAEDLDLDYEGSDLSMYYQKLREKIKQNNLKYVIALDDIDSLFNQKSRKDHGNTVLKRLYEARKDIMNNSEGGLVVIGVTNNLEITDQLDPRNRSRYADDTVEFSPYDALQLRKILEDRAEDAFKDTALEEGVINKIASLVAQDQGDARKAIRLLRTAGKIAEDNDFQAVKKKHVDSAKLRVERELVLNTAEKLPNQKKVLLYALIQHTRKSPRYKQLFDKYESVCKSNDVSRVSERQRRNLISDLEMLGLVSTNPTTVKNGRGNTKNVTSEITQEEIQEDFVTYMEEEVFSIK